MSVPICNHFHHDTDTDMLLIITITVDEILRNVNIDYLE